MQLTESVLIIEDDPSDWKPWSAALNAQGYPTLQANSVKEAVHLLAENELGLALVNLKSDGHIQGLSFIDWVRSNAPGVDVIIISTYATLESSLNAVRQGAFDYLVKPVNPVEVVSRVDRCMTERKEMAERLQTIQKIELMLNQLKQELQPDKKERISAEHILETPGIIVDRRKRLVVQNGEQVQLSPIEFDMLDYLVSNSERVVSASELIRAVQGYEMDETDARPLVRVNIRRLRQKIEADTSNPSHILTVRSRGYRFAV